MTLSSIPVGIISRHVSPGSTTLFASASFVVPHFNTLTIELYGPGGAGGHSSNSYIDGAPGGASAISSLGLIAGAGQGGIHGFGNIANGTFGPGGAGGTASGGDVNTSGSAGQPGYSRTGGAAAASGPGSGGTGGGSGTLEADPVGGGGGGGGAYCKKVFTPAMLTVGGSLAVVVGAPGAANGGDFWAGTAGGPGKAVLTWT